MTCPSSASSDEIDSNMSLLTKAGEALALTPLVVEVIGRYPAEMSAEEHYEKRQKERRLFAAQLRQIHFQLLDFLHDLFRP